MNTSQIASRTDKIKQFALDAGGDQMLGRVCS
jgi:hypothetical protein